MKPKSGRAKGKEINNRNNGTNDDLNKEIGTAVEEFILKTKH